MERVTAIRGATTISENKRAQIEEETLRLIKEILVKNNLTKNNIVSVILSSTNDIDDSYPAEAVTLSGILSGVPLFSAMEPPIKGALPLCIRALVTIMCSEGFEPRHVYLNNAAKLKANTVN